MIKRTVGQIVLCLLLGMSMSGCFKYESKGTVMMDKLVRLDTIWANKDAYIGKVVTITWGRVYMGTTGGTSVGKDNKYYGKSGFFTNINGYTNYEKEFLPVYDSLARIAIVNGDSILPGDYEIDLCHSQYSLQNNPIPAWAEYKGKHLPEYDVNLFETRKEKYVTGVLVDVKKSLNSNFDIQTYQREFYIIPIGYRVSKDTY